MNIEFNKNNLEFEILIGNIKNLIYYYEIDDRERTQYIHVIRKLRYDLIDLVVEPCTPGRSDYLEYLRLVLNCLPKNFKNENISEVIDNLKKIKTPM